MPRVRSLLVLLVLSVGCQKTPGAPPAVVDAAPPPSASASAPAPSASEARPAPNLGLPAEWVARPIASKNGMVRQKTFDSVENGDVFEVARVPISATVRELLVPAGTKIVKAKGEPVLYVATAKRLRFGGHPPGGMTLEAVRANMGCAFKVEGDTLSLGTFGEWDSKEGGATLDLVVRAPSEVRVGVMQELGGAASRAGKGPPDARALGHWYTSPAPTPGWERVSLELDPRHVAARD